MAALFLPFKGFSQGWLLPRKVFNEAALHISSFWLSLLVLSSLFLLICFVSIVINLYLESWSLVLFLFYTWTWSLSLVILLMCNVFVNWIGLSQNMSCLRYFEVTGPWAGTARKVGRAKRAGIARKTAHRAVPRPKARHEARSGTAR